MPKSTPKSKQKDQSVSPDKVSSEDTPVVKKSSPKAEKAAKSVSKASEPETMEELLSQVGSAQLVLKKGETVEGVVVSASAKEILIDIGKKSLGIVAEWELEQVREYAASLKVGDKVMAQVINPENEMGYTTLSLRKTSLERRWTALAKMKESGEDLEVVALELAKGGLLVDWQNLRGFIPATQLDSNDAHNPAALIGRNLKVKILEVDPEINRLVLSQKASVLGISQKVLTDRLGKVKQNDTLSGVISGIAPFGLFVDIDGLEGLVHISEIAWEKVENPGNYFKVGDKVDVMVLDVNKNEGKLNLSIKRLTPDPWKNILDRYPPDSSVSGKVVRLAPYGAFVQIETGVEGLIHISKIPTGSEPKIGDAVECMVEVVDPLKRKISLTLVPKEKPIGYR